MVDEVQAPMGFTVVLLLIAAAVALCLGAVGTFEDPDLAALRAHQGQRVVGRLEALGYL